MKMMLEKMTDHFLPYFSVKGNWIPAPKNEPAWKRETMSAFLVAACFLVTLSKPKPNSFLKEGRARVPPKKPVSSILRLISQGSAREASTNATHNRMQRLPYT